MPETDPFLVFAGKLNLAGISFMVSGSIAAMYYGEPRLTNDVDIVVFLEASDIDKLVSAFPLEEFYCPPGEVIQVELARQRRGHFNLIHHSSGFKADIYPVGTDPLHLWAADRTNRSRIDGVDVTFAPPEYVIVRKLQYFKEGRAEKHLRDIRRMLVGMGDDWGQDALIELISEYGLDDEWEKARHFDS